MPRGDETRATDLAPMEFEDVRYPYAEKTVAAAGVNVVAIDEGKGEPAVVFLPAAGRGLTHFEKVYAPIIAAGHRVIGVDLPGWGKSEKPDATYSIEWYLHWLERFLRALDLERAVLVGNSMGGILAALHAERHPETPGVALLAPAGGPQPFLKRQIASYALSEAQLLSVGPRRWRIAVSQNFHNPIPELEEIVRRGLAISKGKGWPAYCRALSRGARAALGFDLVPHLDKIRCPVLLLWGREDRMCPASWATIFAPRLARARVRVIEGCGHFPSIERPEETERELLSWLREDVVRA
ncbi:alpha/beta hydrolase [bacterium]|nr:alpha/beta hydrolase [bacterium]